jgi:hypothetical protein
VRFVVVLAVLALAVAGVAYVGTWASSGSGRSAGALAPVPDVPTVTAAPTAPAAPPPELTPTVLGVAQRWATAWADHPPGMTGDQWSNRLRPYTTDEYLPVLASVDPANVPSSRVTGPPRAVEVHPESLRVDVPTDAVILQLLVVQVGPGDWRVAGYDRAS